MKPFRNETEARNWLKGKLGLAPDKFKVVWQELKAEETIHFALDEPDGPEELLRRARRLVAYGKKLQAADGRRGRIQDPEFIGFMTKEEQLRARALSAYLAQQADSDGDVMGFRRDVLDNARLPQSDALGFLNSLATAMLSSKDFNRYGIPVLKHRAKATDLKIYGDEAISNVESDVQVEWDDRCEVIKRRIQSSRRDHTMVWNELPYCPDPLSLRERRVPVWPRSVLDDLRVLAFALAGRYPWRRAAATWFVLTGTPPHVSPVWQDIRIMLGRSYPDEPDSSPTFCRHQFALMVEPWLSAQTVAKIYRAYQKATHGKDKRMPSAKVLELFMFVTALQGSKGEGATWEHICQQWNRKHQDQPAMQYGSYSSIREAYVRARQTIAFSESPKSAVFSRPGKG